MKEGKVTVILPVHDITDDTVELFKKSLSSVETQLEKPDSVLIVHTNHVTKKIEEILKELKLDKDNYYKLLLNDSVHTDFCSQINLGVKNVDTEYFSILELDDEYSKIWFKNVNEYIKFYPNTGLFLPIIVEVDIENKFVSFTNESIWAQGFSEKIGLLDINTLLNFPNFSTSGSVFKKEEYDEVGGFKNNIKLSFMYELLLRVANDDIPITTIPKIGYLHKNGRPGSLFDMYKSTIDSQKANFWMSKAKTEYFFTNQREILDEPV
jgi:hypothetical protein